MSIEEVMKKLDTIQNKIKHKILGKTQVSRKKVGMKRKLNETEMDEDHALNLMRKQ